MKALRLTFLSAVVCLGAMLAQAQEGGESATAADTSELEKGKSKFKETWVHPDADFSQYNKLYLWEATFEYRDVGPAQKSRSTVMSTRKREFGISDADRTAFEDIVREAFVKGLQRGKRFEIASDVGPNTLIMRGSALDIVSLVPPDTIGRSDIYLASVGEATLVLELLDAETGGVLAVVSERRKMGSGRIDEWSMPANRTSIMSEIKRWAQSAGSKLGSELDKAIAGK